MKKLLIYLIYILTSKRTIRSLLAEKEIPQKKAKITCSQKLNVDEHHMNHDANNLAINDQVNIVQNDTNENNAKILRENYGELIDYLVSIQDNSEEIAKFEKKYTKLC
ncbi:hypothetical protein TUBRATIS_27020 [Tubulinosema ratisbonensis]|uniref:Uncharacterized protein n=1 Tax=Tubulinosema ratisbonensis TaxID=291195 RepID=A0A437AI64_9MICR|nr:hypothetical protein TUBRATIS_27020 [Tubulinosema ratisbonensis]